MLNMIGQQKQFDWNRARAFLATAETGSMTAAAKRLGLSQSTLSRQIDALEQELGVVLFEKVGRALVLTPSSRALLSHVKAMNEAASALALSVDQQADSISGSVSITATEVMAAYILPPIVQKLMQQAPELNIEVIASNEASDLRIREADIAIRNFETTHDELICRKLPNGFAHLYASKEYLAKFRDPLSMRNPSQLDLIGFIENQAYIDGLKAHGLDVVPEQFVVSTNSHLSHWEMVKQGLAIGVMPNIVGELEVGVRRALQDMPPLPFETWLVVHRELRYTKKIRLVYDFLYEELHSILSHWQETNV